MTSGQDGHDDDGAIRAAIARCAAAAQCDVEDLGVRLVGGKRAVRVVLDRDGGVDLDTAATVSREIAAILDTQFDHVVGDAPYTLEVTSRGVGAPLTETRHFRRAAGRLVTLITADGAERTVRLLAVDGTDLVYLDGRDAVQPRRMPFEDISRAKAEIEFSPPPEQVRAVLDHWRVALSGGESPVGEGGLGR